MPKVRLTQKVGRYKKGAVVTSDDGSASQLVESKRGELVVDDAPEGEPFDPSAHNVDAVNEYLSSASEAERHRVLAAERAGKARTTVLDA